jgi:hypothetical protein
VIDADAGKTSLEAVVPPGSAARRVKIDETLVSFPEPKVTLTHLACFSFARDPGVNMGPS